MWTVADPVFSNPSLRFINFRRIAIILFLAYSFLFAFRYRRNFGSRNLLLLIACFATVGAPFLLTGAHENHFFLGVMTLFLVAVVYDGRFYKYYLALSALQFLNLVCYYGITGDFNGRYGEIISKLNSIYLYNYVALAASILMILLFAGMFYELFRSLRHKDTDTILSPSLPTR